MIYNLLITFCTIDNFKVTHVFVVYFSPSYVQHKCKFSFTCSFNSVMLFLILERLTYYQTFMKEHLRVGFCSIF